jgi:Lrp/AsnC family leucine-responsive transcriptional regulator
MSALSLDDIDRRLLQLVQQDADRPIKDLAAAVAVSDSSARRRLRRLRAAGVIERTVAVVNPAAVGKPLFLVVDVTLEREDVSSVTTFKREMQTTPEVVLCYHLTGEHTFMLIVCLADMDHFAAFAARVFEGHPGVRKFRTSAVMARVKHHAPIPL